MAKVLVADDNSNIQKMVGLVLKDQGIEVVAVGNGEAAVRKIPDVRPDVVLADVFMPVRNGYEVCEFVKKHNTLSRIPVILLVGAFDPLDEQEAQRVGADGVLKKPFVPADPLISMVKSALARAGADAPLPAAVSRLTVESAPSAPTAPVIASIPSFPPAEFPSPTASPELGAHAAEEVSAGSHPLSADEGRQPLAFGSLLETASEEKVAEEDQSYLPVSHPGLTEQRTWDTPAGDEGEEDAQETPSWRAGVDDLLDSAAAFTPKTVSDWRDSVPATASQDAAPVVEVSPPQEPARASEAVPSSEIPAPQPTSSYWPVEQSPAAPQAESQGTSNEQVLEGKASLPPSFTPENFPGLFVEEKAAPVPESPQLTQEPLVEQEFIPPASTAGNWEEEVRRAARLVTTWESVPAVPQPPAPAEEAASSVPETSSTWPAPQPAAPPFSSFEPPAGDAAEHSPSESHWPGEASGVTEPAAPSHWPGESSSVGEPAAPSQFDPPTWYRNFQVTPASNPVSEQPVPAQEESQETPAPQSAEPASTPDMDALVAKVLEKMNPNVLKQVTQEILKPVVEALVRDELDKKK